MPAGQPVRQPRLMIVISEDWFFWSHRRALAVAAREAGYDVTVATPVRQHADAIRGLGLTLVPLRALRRSSRLPHHEVRSIAELRRVYVNVKPDIVHHVTIKPVLYGSVAARLAGVPAVVNGIYGLGHVFADAGVRAMMVRAAVTAAYRSAFALVRPRLRVTFENADDRQVFLARHITRPDEAIVIRGMGFDPAAFTPRTPPAGLPIVMMAGRLLWTKGVGDLVQAVQHLRQRGLVCRLALVGAPDQENPESIPEATLRAWHEQGSAEWWGRREDMPDVLAQASIVALPSFYGEGLPKILIEAAGAGRPLVASDIPACREIVREGRNGFLVPPQNVTALADALAKLLGDSELRERFGAYGHELARREFSDEVVNASTLRVYQDLLALERQD